MKTVKITAAVLTLVFVLFAVPATLAAGTLSAAAGIPKAENVKYVADKGSDDNSGDTASAPYATFQLAVSKLAKTGGVIVIVGRVTITENNCVMEPNEKLISVTSYYDGKDYRAVKYVGDVTDPCISLANGVTSLDFYGEFMFDYIVFNTEKNNCILAFNYNSFEMGADIETTFTAADGIAWFDGIFDNVAGSREKPPILIVGQNKKIGGEVITDDVTVSVAGGTWQGIRLGDRDNILLNTYAGKADIAVSGGLFTSFTAAISTAYQTNIMGAYQTCTEPEAVISMTVTGGTFNGQISAIGYIGTISAGDYFQKGTFYMNIFGGKWNRVYNADGNFIHTVQNDMKPGITDATVIVSVDTDKLTYGDYNTLKFVSSVMVRSTLFLSRAADNITYSDFEKSYTQAFSAITLPAGVTASSIASVKVGDLEMKYAARVEGASLIVPSDGKSTVVLTAGGKTYSAAYGATSFGGAGAETTAAGSTTAAGTTAAGGTTAAAGAESSAGTGSPSLAVMAAALVSLAAVLFICKKNFAGEGRG